MGSRSKTRHEIEAQCLDIYRRLLDRPDLGALDPYADTGGGSMKAILIAIELEKAFGVDVPMLTFYDKKNVAEMSDWLAGGRVTQSAEAQ